MVDQAQVEAHAEPGLARSCESCGASFVPRRPRDLRRGNWGRFCSRPCAARAAGKRGGAAAGKLDWTGANNPSWKGGISKQAYRYKLIQKERYPERVQAREKVRAAIRAHRLTRQPCERCGSANVFAHHEDYSRPLDVRWLCRPCHRAEHGGRH